MTTTTAAAVKNGDAAEETEDRRRVRNVALAFKIAAENDRVRASWQPFMALCEAVYPFFNPVVFHRSTLGCSTRTIDGIAFSQPCCKDGRACGMMLEAAAVSVGAERCARELRARFYDRRLEPRIARYLYALAHRARTVAVYGTLEVLMRRYDSLSARPWDNGLYVDFNGDLEAIWTVMCSCKLSMYAIHDAMCESLSKCDGLFLRCLRWAEQCHDGGDGHERVMSGTMLNTFHENAATYCDSAIRSMHVDAIRAIADSPLFDTYDGGDELDACVTMLEAMVNHPRTPEELPDDKCDLLLRLLHVDTKVPPETLYYCAARYGCMGNGRMMCKLMDALRSVGGVREFPNAHRDKVASLLTLTAAWHWEPYGIYRRAVDAAADLVRLVKVRPFSEDEKCVLRASGSRLLRAVAGEPVGIDFESVLKSESESGSESESESGSESGDDGPTPPDAKRKKLN